MIHPRPRLASLVVAALAAVPAVAAAQPAGAPAKPAKPACGVSAIPLQVGNEWTYEPAPSAVPEDRQLTDAQKRTTPTQPLKLTIKVKAIDTKDKVTTVTLTEDHDGRVHETWIKCTDGGATFQMSPDSFWFAGEPGTTYGIELSEIQRKGQTLGLTGGKITALEWHDDFSAKWKHVIVGKVAKPTVKSGTIDVERHWVQQPFEAVTTKLGSWKVLKLGIEINIKTTIDPMPPEPLKPTAMIVNFLWMLDGIGPVQLINTYGQGYQLTATNLPVPASTVK